VYLKLDNFFVMLYFALSPGSCQLVTTLGLCLSQDERRPMAIAVVVSG